MKTRKPPAAAWIGFCVLLGACDRPNPATHCPPRPPQPPPGGFRKIEHPGSLSGRILFKGEYTPVQIRRDPQCRANDPGPVFDESLVVNENGTLRDVLVYVKGDFRAYDIPRRTDPVRINQKGCVYRPHAVALQLGQAVRFRNSDTVNHNIHSRPNKNKPFNFSQNPGEEDEYYFRSPEIGIPVGCDVHSWMRATVHVLPHPFFALTGKDGTFSIGGLPPGRWTLVAWHEFLGTKELPVEIGRGEKKAGLVFTFP